MREQIKLPSGRILHRWTQSDGEWACVAYDHGPMCRRCQKVDETLAGCLENVMDGHMDVKDDSERGMVFHVTENGQRYVRQMLKNSE